MGSPVNTIGQFERKNLLINGGFDFAQRRPSGNSALTSTGGNYLTLDRWLHGFSSVTSPTCQRTANNFVGPNTSQRQCSASGTFSVGGELIHRQRIEASIVRELARTSKSVSFGFWLQGSGPERVRVGLSYPTAFDNWASSTEFYTANAALPNGTMTYYKFENIPLNANCENGLRLDIQIQSVAFSGAADTWLAEVMLNEGSSIAPFRRRGVTIEDELQLCQRYYQKTYRPDGVPGSAGANDGVVTGYAVVTGAQTANINHTYYEEMRVAPACTIYNSSTGALNTWRDTGGADITIGIQSIGLKNLWAINTSSMNQARYAAGHITMDAEL